MEKVVTISHTKTDNFIVEQKNVPLKNRRFKIRGKILAANFPTSDEAYDYIMNHRYILTNYQLKLPFHEDNSGKY